MKKNTGLFVLISVFVCMLLVVAACGRKDASRDSDRPKENPYAGISKADMKYQNIQIVNFTITPRGVQETGDPQRYLNESQKSCEEVLTASNLFANVRSVSSAERANSTMIVQGELTKLRVVGVGARIWVGGLAGKSEMVVYVKLIDASTGKVINEKEIRDDTQFAGAWSFGASDQTMHLRVGNVIADYVINAARK